MEDRGTLKWRFDVSTFRLIGRDLITDRVTALFELIKNCYDANATEVIVTFDKVGTQNKESSIIIEDNGVGMSFSDIRDKWMVIGTSSKRKNPYSPQPFNRRCVGEKGIGRFAVDKLGETLRISTKQANDNKLLNIDINWSDYYSIPQKENESSKYFTDIENVYQYINAEKVYLSGTTIKISKIHDAWTKQDIIRLLRETAKIVSPFEQLTYPFRIHVIAHEYQIDAWADDFKIDASSLATLSCEIACKNGKQECMLFDEATGTIDVRTTEVPIFGGVSVKLYYFDGRAREAFRRKFPNAQIDGVKIYRDGIITTPFAEHEESQDRKRDILGIDKRLWISLFDKVATRELIGIVNITKDGNPHIIDATNRQDFSDTLEYRALKQFILDQIYAFDQFKVFMRKKNRSEQTKKIQKVGDDISEILTKVSEITKSRPELSELLDPLEKLAKKTGKEIAVAAKEQKDAEEEQLRHENMYMRIMSRQEDAINVTHAVKTSIGKIQRQANFFNERFPNEKFNDYFSLYAKQIYREMVQLNRATDEIFDYSKTNLPFADIDLKQLIEYLIQSYASRFEECRIEWEAIVEDNLVINCNEMFFYDIVQNVTDNAIKAMQNSSVKKYRCTVKAQEEKLLMDFSDTGCGIPIEKREWVFGIYNTTTEEQGGGGIGLYAVRLRVNALRGKVYVVDSEFAPLGTTIHVELPFKK